MELDRQFGRDLTDALLDQAEAEVLADVDAAIARSHERLRDWADERDYHVEPVIESLGEPTVDRWRWGLRVTWGWDHPAAPYFQYGTSEHTIRGDPVLSFVWDADDAPRWVKKEFDREGDGYRVFFGEVEVSGVARTNFVGAGIRWLRENL